MVVLYLNMDKSLCEVEELRSELKKLMCAMINCKKPHYGMSIEDFCDGDERLSLRNPERLIDQILCYKKDKVEDFAQIRICMQDGIEVDSALYQYPEGWRRAKVIIMELLDNVVMDEQITQSPKYMAILNEVFALGKKMGFSVKKDIQIERHNVTHCI